LPSMVASSRESVEKACSVTDVEREDHLNRAGLGGLDFASYSLNELILLGL
jgi:hypothetical protein